MHRIQHKPYQPKTGNPKCKSTGSGVDFGSRSLSIAWKVILVADLGVLLYGIMAVLTPEILSEGFRIFTGQDLAVLAFIDPRMAEYLLLLWRLLGALNVAFAVGAIAIALTGFRRGEMWSWLALLIINTVGYGSPIAFDLTVGAIGVFEELEIILLVLIYGALAISARDVLRKR